MRAESYLVSISFGDCDPAGIVFYPNVLRWSDAAFHHLLRRHGGHDHICRSLQAVGIGVAESGARFLSPLRDGDALTITTQITDWGRKTFTLVHSGRVGARDAFEVKEIRCLFKAKESVIVAAEVGALRALLDEADG
jgi:4-hydroxybenzoyl-CoA thioesterase